MQTTPSTELPRAAIVGLGITETGKVYGRTARDFAADAARRAVADAGLTLDDVDGLLLSNGVTAVSQIQYAALAIAGGLATTVVCVHADAPLQPAERSGQVYKARRAGPA